MIRVFLTIFILVGGVFPAAAEQRSGPDFYAFYNGLPSGTLEEQALFLKETGYHGVNQVYAREGKEKIARRVEVFEKAGIKVLSVYVGATREPVEKDLVGPLADRGAMIELTVTKLDDEVLASIRKTVAMAETLGIKVALYPHAGFAVATMPQAMALIEKVGHSNLGVMFNLCHFLKNEKAEDLEKVLAMAGDRLFAVSTCGADLDGKGWNELIRTLDEGTFPQDRLFKQLDKMGFEGPVGLQCYALKGDKKENLRKSMKAWRELQERLGADR
jgi:sugar phosphate isomerase/epimerase